MKKKYLTMCHLIGGTVCAGALLLMGSNSPAQNLFVGSYGSENITEIPTSGPNVVFATGLDYPTGLAFNSAGDLFEGDQFSGNIYEYANPLTAGKTPTMFASGLTQPNAIVFDTYGNMFVNINGSAIYEFTTGGAKIPFLSAPQLSGLAFNSAGNLFVGNDNGGGAGNGYIIEVTPAGSTNIYATGLSDPQGMAFNAAGDLFVTGGSEHNTITEITPTGTQSLFASGLDGPVALAFNSAGDLFVADEGQSDNGNITEFSPNGTQLAVITSVSKPASLAFQGLALPVPEPSVLGLLSAGVAFLFLRRRKN